MTRRELEQMLKGKDGISTYKEAGIILDAFIMSLSEFLLTTGSATIPGFGTFKIVQQKARKGRNPRSGASVEVPAKLKVSFTAATAIKKVLNPK